MHKLILAGVVLAVAGFMAGRWTTTPEPRRPAIRTATETPVETSYAVTRPVISETDAQHFRESNYEGITTIEGVLELPSDFAQTEALYAVAGRASREELETLIHESIDIANRYDRSAALRILFSRYAELDPDAAVAFLVDLELDIDEQVFSALFEVWAKSDLNGAVAAANRLTNRRQRKRASHAILTTASRYHGGLLDQVAANLDDHHHVDHIRSEAVGIRANSNPQRALQEALSMDTMRGRWDAVRRVAAVWARNDPASALQHVDQISDQNMRRQFLSTVLQRWIEDDPVQAMQYVSTYPNVAERQDMLEQGLGVYAQIEPREAFTMALDLTGSAREGALMGVLNQWARDDIDGAMLAINGLEDITQREMLLNTVGQAVAQQGAGKALAWLDSLDEDTRKLQLSAMLPQIAYQEPRLALEYALSRTSEAERTGLLKSVLQYTLANSPEVAEDYIDQLSEGPERESLYQNLAGHRARSGGEAALQWIATLSGGAKRSALKGAAQALAGSDPQLSASLINQMPDEDAADVMRMVVSRMTINRRGVSNSQAAVDWLEQFSGRPGYQEAMSSVVQVMAQRDPQQALSLSRRLDDARRQDAVSVAMHYWASSDPVSAADWARRADPVVQTRAVESVVAGWAASDPASAERWVFTLPESDGRDRALGHLATTSSDTARMADLVGAISSDTMREQAIVSAYNIIARRMGDARAASEFLDNVGASEALREQLSFMGRN